MTIWVTGGSIIFETTKPNRSKELIDTVTHANLYSCLYAAHQRNRAALLLVVKEERPVRKPADNVIAPILLDNPVSSHTVIIPKLGYCINSTVSISSDPSFPQ